MRPATDELVTRIRNLCASLPKVVESARTASGVGAFDGTGVISLKVSGRVVARLFVLDPHGRENVVLWIRVEPLEREALVGSGRGYLRAGQREVAINLDAETDWTEIADLVTDSYLLMAPKKLAAQVDAALRELS